MTYCSPRNSGDLAQQEPIGLAQRSTDNHVVPSGESSRSGHPTRFWAGRVYHVPEAMDWLIGTKCAKAISKLAWKAGHHQGPHPFEMYHEALSREAQVGESTIREGLWRARKLGWVMVRKGGRRRDPTLKRYLSYANQYRFNWQKLHADLAQAELQMCKESIRHDLTVRWNAVRAGGSAHPLLLATELPASGKTDTGSRHVNAAYVKRMMQSECQEYEPRFRTIRSTLQGLEHMDWLEDDLPWWEPKKRSRHEQCTPVAAGW